MNLKIIFDIYYISIIHVYNLHDFYHFLDMQYEITKEIMNKQLKVTSKLANDVREHVNHMVIVGHEELYICLCTIFFWST
jgi:hypothetical protein